MAKPHEWGGLDWQNGIAAPNKLGASVIQPKRRQLAIPAVCEWVTQGCDSDKREAKRSLQKNP